MRDVRLVAIAASQHNRISRRQILDLDPREKAIEHRLARGDLVIVEEGVYAFPPVLADPWGRWMGATLTSPETYLAVESAAVAYAWLSREPDRVQVMRPGDGGPREHGSLLVFHSRMLEGEVGTLGVVPVTSPERTLLDLASRVSGRALARAIREAVRLEHTTLLAVTEFVLERRRRRGSRALLTALGRYAGLPIERARSGAEVAAVIVFRDAGYEVPRLNREVAGVEADLSWPRLRLIIEIDGGPFHLDRGADAQRTVHWEAAGWTVRRCPAEDVEEHPERLLALAPEANVREHRL